MRARLSLTATVLLGLLLGTLGVQAQGMTIEEDILYRGQAEPDARLDLYLPTDADPPLPAVVYIAPPMLPDENLAGAYAAHLADQGYALVGVTTRMGALMPDSFCALAWLHANANDLGLDPTRIVAFGISGGAIPAALIGAVGDAEHQFMDGCPNPVPSEPWVSGVLAYDGLLMTPVALGQPLVREDSATLRGLPREEIDALYDRLIATPPSAWLAFDDGVPGHASIVHGFAPAWIDGDEPPHLLLYGAASGLDWIGVEQHTFAGYLESVGVPVEVVGVPDLTHDVTALVAHPDEMDAFLAEVFGATVPVETATSTHVTGTVLEQTRYESDDVSASQDGDVMREEGHVYKQRVDWSDPRLPSEHWVRMDLSIHDEGSEDGVMTVQTSHLLTDGDGAWRGTGRALETESDRYSYYELTGEGAYEGLHALLRGTPGSDAPGPWDLAYEGWIFQGPLTGFPEPAEPASGEGLAMRTAPDPEAVTGSSAAEPSDPMAPAAFLYTLEIQGEPDWGVRQDSADGSMIERRGFEKLERLEATDPRASGLMTTSENWTQVEAGGTRVDTSSVTVRLTNDGGSWSGPGEFIEASSDQVMEMAGITTLTGEGDYEGLTLYLSLTGDFLSHTYWGMIVPTELVAPVPAPVEPDEE